MDTNGQPLTDDAELDKVLQGMQDGGASPTATPSGLNFEPTPGPVPAAPPVAATPDQTDPVVDTVALPPVDTPVAPVEPAPAPVVAPVYSAGDPSLDAIKKDALDQLRPLVDKLNLPPDEKFETLLLIIRSTDDKSLVQSAYEAAKAITDETKRANAMLDVIKEIDYFNNSAAGQPQL